MVKKYNYFYIKTSAKDNIGINEAFNEIAKVVKQHMKEHKDEEILSKESKSVIREPVA